MDVIKMRRASFRGRQWRRSDGPRQGAMAGKWRRLLSRTLILAGGLGLAGGAAVFGAASPAAALGAGQVCMVNQPTGAPSSGGTLGHVGWMYMVGGTDQWVAGSTDGAVSASNPKKMVWKRTGLKSTLLNYFHADGYVKFRCHSTATSAVGAANNMVTERDAQNFNTLSNNCLEDSVAIFMAYDSSMDLYQGYGDGPNYYFDHLTTFGPVRYLSANN